ncbi:MAG: hypothetical protein H7Y28_14775, partial [Rhodoferax sp.]|nr:hypothetical protein [Rhodoferax sp.]
VSSWWAQHPLRLASLLAVDAVKTAVQPIAQRSPLGLILGAAAVGGLLFRFRPWRWIPKPLIVAGLLPHLLSKVMGQTRPLSWLAILSTVAQHQNRPERQIVSKNSL